MADKKPRSAEAIAGSYTTGIISKTATAPLDRVRILLQCQNEIVKAGRLGTLYKGAIDCTKRTFRSEGLRSFWRGNFTNCLITLPTYPLHFALKDKVQAMLKVENMDSYAKKIGINVMTGSMTGVINCFVVYSLDYARTRLINDVKTAGKGGAERQFKGLIDVYTKTLKSDGVVGLYRGFVVSCVGIAVYRGCYFGLYDTLKPIVLADETSLGASFALGYGVAVSAGLLSYPLDTIRKRMLMRSCETVKYKGSIDCGMQIIRNEGFLSLMKGAGVAIVSSVAGGCMLAGFDRFKKYYMRKADR